MLVGAFFLGFDIANARSVGAIMDSLATRGLPLAPLLFWTGVANQSIAGLLLVMGYQAPRAVAALVPCTLIAPIIFHHFWSLRDEARLLNRIIFICDYTCVIGALLLIATADPEVWTFSWPSTAETPRFQSCHLSPSILGEPMKQWTLTAASSRAPGQTLHG